MKEARGRAGFSLSSACSVYSLLAAQREASLRRADARLELAHHRLRLLRILLSGGQHAGPPRRGFRKGGFVFFVLGGGSLLIQVEAGVRGTWIRERVLRPDRLDCEVPWPVNWVKSQDLQEVPS